MKLQRNFAASPMTAQQARTQLAMDLANTPDDRLFALTVLALKPRYKLTAREIETVLLAKQATRRRFIETGELA